MQYEAEEPSQGVIGNHLPFFWEQVPASKLPLTFAEQQCCFFLGKHGRSGAWQRHCLRKQAESGGGRGRQRAFPKSS